MTLGTGSGNIKDPDPIKTSTPTDAPKAGWLQKIIDALVGILTWVYTPVIITLYTLPTIDGCIFGAQDYFKLSFFEATPTGIAGSIQGYIGAAYNAFRYLVTAVYVVVLVYIGIRMILSSVGRQKAQYKEMFKHWLIGLLLIFSFHWVMAGIIWLCNTFVEILQGISMKLLDLEDAGLSLTGVLNSLNLLDASGLTNIAPAEHPVTSFICYNISQGTAPIPFIGVILGLILFLVLLGASISIIFTYLKRLFTISLLILLFPFVALSYVFDKMGDRKAQTLSFWMKEFTVNVMIQPIHALLLVMISLIFSTALDDSSIALFGANIAGAILSVGILFLIPMGEKLLKQLFQISSSMGSGRDGIAGSAAKAGMAFHGAQKLGSTFSNMGKTITATRRARIANGLSEKHAGKDAYKNAIASGKSETAARAAQAAAQAKARADRTNKNSDAYKNYLATLRKETGMKSSAGATAKAVATVAGMALGAGTAITSSESLGGLVGNIATHSAAGGAASGGLVGLPNKIGQTIKGDDLAAKDYISRREKAAKTNLDGTSPEVTKLKHKIAADLGIDVSMVNNANKQRILDDYSAMERYTRFGGTDKDTMMALTSNGKAVKNIKDGLMPDGSGPLNPAGFTVTQTNRGMLVSDGTNQYYMADKGNSKLRPGEVIELPLADVLAGTTQPAGVQQYVDNNQSVQHAHAQLASDITAQQTAVTRLSEAENKRVQALDTLVATSEAKELQELTVQAAEQAVTDAKIERAHHPGDASYQEAVITAEAALHREQTTLNTLTNQFNAAEKEVTATTHAVEQAHVQVENANRKVESSARNVESATSKATETYDAVFSAVNESVTDTPHAPASPSITYSNNPPPPAEPIRAFGLTGLGAAEAMNALNSSGSTSATVHDHGDHVTINGTDYPDCTVASFSGISGSATIVKKDGNWYVE